MRNFIFFLILILVVFFVFFFKSKTSHIPGYYEIIKDKQNIPIVRVLLMENISEVDISVGGNFHLLNAQNAVHRMGKNGIKKMTLKNSSADGGLVTILPNLKDPLYTKYIRLHSVEGEPILLNGKHFVGDIIFRAQPDQMLQVINEIDLETYLIGVLLGETFDTFHIEALKAQVITSRTFALSEMKTRQNQPWHVRSSVKSQVFKGMTAVPQKIITAVQETKGEVMNDKGSVFRAYFCSSCGGATANVTTLPWESDKSSVMQARECVYCAKMKPSNFSWSVAYSANQLLSAFHEAGYTLDHIKNLKIESEDTFGRALSLSVSDAQQTISINALRFRVEILKDTAKLRSCFFTLKSEKGYYQFEGKGWGHGVGLCQYGSQGLAKEKKSCYEILQFYFLGVQFAKYY